MSSNYTCSAPNSSKAPLSTSDTSLKCNIQRQHCWTSISCQLMAVDCSIYCFHCDHNTHCLPPKFCITIFSNFSWVLQSSQEKPKTMVCKISGCKQGQGAKKIIFTAWHSGKLKLAFISPDVISTRPKNFLTSRIDFTVLLLFEFLKKYHLPVG